MIEKLVTTFVDFQLGIGTIQDDDVSVYRYGYTLMIEVILNISLSLILGALLGQVKEVIFFLCMFIPLRSFSGGYHANKAWKCILLSNLAVVGVIVLSKLMIFNQFPQFIKNINTILTAFVIMLLSPVENKNRELSVCEKKIYKFCTWIIMAIEVIIEIALFSVEAVVYYHIVLMAQIIQFFSLILTLRQSSKDNKSIDKR